MKPKAKRKLDWKKALSVASDILPKIPKFGDGPLTIAVKALAMFDSVSKAMIPPDKSTLEFFREFSLEPGSNNQFVDMFFGTNLREAFKLRKIPIGDTTEIIEASNPEIGTIYFIERTWGSQPVLSQDFWYTHGFNFEMALEVLWSQFGNRIHLGLVEDEWRMKAVYSEIPEPKDPLLGSGLRALEAFKEQHIRYMRDGVPRTYLFAGLQGVGKTTFALRLSEGRTLRVDANGMATVQTKDLDFLLQGLKPDFLIVDDIDRAPELATSLPTLFSILTDFKGKFPKVTVVLTINDIKKLDAALIRPGRVDETVDFKAPNPEDRRLILLGYIHEFRILEDSGALAALVDATEGLTAAYLREVALQLRYKPIERVLEIVAKMVESVAPKPPKKTNGAPESNKVDKPESKDPPTSWPS